VATDRLIDLGLAIGDGIEIDWSSSGTGASPDRGIIDELRLVEAIARAHARLPQSGTPGGSGSSHRALPALFHQPAQEETPLSWGRLSIVSTIGRGTYGTVYRAYDAQLDRTVALKLLKRDHPRSDRLDSAVIDEGRLLARIQHPNVIAIYGAERIDGRVGLWMEFVDGPTLEDDLRAHGPYTAQGLVQVGVDLCRALAAVHQAGVLHRDLKAQNVMRHRDGRILLADFGAGREQERDDAMAAASGREALAGTPLYLAPEVLAGGPASSASDIYGLGVLLFHLATGSFPVRGRSVGDLTAQHQRVAPTPLSTLRPDLPRRLVSATERATRRDPHERFASASEFEAALQPLTHGARQTRRRSVLAIAATTAIALAAAGWQWMAAPGGAGDLPDLGGSIVRQVRPRWSRAVVLAGPFPDGRSAACIDRDTYNAAVCDLATGDVRLVTTAGSRAPERRATGVAVSADGLRLAYGWIDGSRQEIREVHVDGSNDHVVLRADPDDRFIRVLGWTHDDRDIVTAIADATNVQRWGLVPADGRAPQWVKRFAAFPPDALALSPDGRYLAFDTVPRDGEAARDIHVLDVVSGDEWPLIQDPSNDVTPVWAPAGDRLVFTSDRLGTMGFWSLRVIDGRAAGEVALVRDMGRSGLRPVGFTARSGLLYAVQTGWFDVYTAPLDVASGLIGTPSRVSTRPLDQNMAADWTASGDRIAFVSGTGSRAPGSSRIVIKDVGSARETLLPHRGLVQQTQLRWTRDGARVLAMWFDPPSRRMLLAEVDTASGQHLRAIDVDPDAQALELSADGRDMFLTAGDRLMAVDLATATSRVLHRVLAPDRLDGFGGVAVSPDNRWLAFVTTAENRCTIRLLPTAGGAARERLREDAPCGGPAWTPDGASLLFTKLTDDVNRRSTVQMMGAFSGEPRPLPLTMEQVVQMRVKPDGRALLFTAGYPREEHWIMESFLDEAR
jgi:tRNA A-37 threonylcarbamoyl transferase component Bud32